MSRRAGRVLVDGIDLSTVRLDSYRTQLGVVLQDTFLFDGTIRENVDVFAARRAAKKTFWPPAASRAWTNSRNRSRSATTRWSASAASSFPAASASASPSRAPSWPIRGF